MEKEYSNFAARQEKEFESVCKRCGECCGSMDDPCSNLIRQSDGVFCCAVYDSRIGPQKTVSGAAFNCVHIREHIKNNTLRPGCAYRNIR